MGVCVGDLNPRQLEGFRVEVAESLAAHLAYPPFFDYRSGKLLTRPLNRGKREEIDQFVRSANFGPVDRSDITSTDLRRFLERLLYRYIEVNEVFRRTHVSRRAPQLRSLVPRLAAEIQRGLVAHLQNNTPQFGARRPGASWSEGPRTGAARENFEHNTRVLEAVLIRQAVDAVSQPATTASPPATLGPSSPTRHAASWPTGSYDATIPVQSQGFGAPFGASPFAGLETGPQSTVFGAKTPLSEMRTGPLAIPTARGNGNAPSASAPPTSTPRELPPDLYHLYGEYLRDMEPEAASPQTTASVAPAIMDAPTSALPIPAFSASQAPDRGPASAVRDSAANGRAAPAEANGNHSDKLIFFQLRYQLEAYVRRAARSYGVSSASADPSGVLDALRRSGFVDEADLRIAEGNLALTDRVTATGTASADDYRQALMLYLLYHRSHLG